MDGRTRTACTGCLPANFNLQGTLHLEAAQSYAQTFADSAVKAVHRASGEYPSGKPWEVLTVEFTVPGIPCLGLNGGPAFKRSEAFSFRVATYDQTEGVAKWFGNS